jgi:DNA helicase-2/ATP-dependent DNA helicase PcrA
VDEFQDLTPQQLRMVESLGGDKVTYAGDLAQGIYSFAGAAPNTVYESIQRGAKEQIVFAESHRSSPSVLDLVNALTSYTGSEQLTCATPDKWTAGGLAGVGNFGGVDDEARFVYKFAAYVLERAPTHRVGVICRTAGRRRFADEVFQSGSLPWRRWDDPLMDRDTANAVIRILSNWKREAWLTAENPTDLLLNMADSESLQDPDTRKSLREAVEWVHDELSRGVDISELKARVKVGDSSGLINSAGVHLLSGHAGKGQQFDWVCVIGAEEGVLPFFKATSPEELAEEGRILSVMISRARHGALVLHSKSVPDASGRERSKQPSRYQALLKAAPSCLTGSNIVNWLKTADWNEIAAN